MIEVIIKIGIQVALIFIALGISVIIFYFTNRLDKIEDIVKEILEEIKK